MLESELKSKINSLWDKFWSGGIANPLTAIEQMSYLIFMKRIEDQDNKLVKRHAADKGYQSLFDGKFKVGNNEYNKKICKWSEWKHLPADEMLTHVREVVFPFIKTLHNGENTFFAEHMKDAVFLIPKASLLQEAVAIIDELNISMRNIDTQGDIYEYLLSELKTSGKNGQFRTPRHIIRMMIKLVDPDINDRICDPACGTGGFLINAYEHILAKYTPKEQLKIDDDGEIHGAVGSKITKREHWEKLWEKTFYGFDFDTTMVRIGLMNMILHGIKKPHITYLDSLSKRNNIRAEYTVVLANPPFTGSIDVDDINDAFKVKTTKTELLFLELFYRTLEMGGRAAVVVPNGILFGNTNAHKEMRKTILKNCQLQAVITIPSGVFKPYSGVGTAILVFTKGGDTDKVWFYDMKSDGYTLDDKREKIDGKGDIPDIINSFNTKSVGPNSIVIDIKEIEKNDWNLNIITYIEDDFKEIEYEDPKETLENLLEKQEEIKKELLALQSIKFESSSKKDLEKEFQDVADFLRGPFGSSVKKSVCVPKGKNTFKLYEQGNVIQNDFNRGTYYLDKERFNDLKKFEIAPGDILITCAGTLGKIAIVPEGIERGIFNSVLMRIRPNPNKILTKYFYYYFGSAYVQSKIFSKSYGATIKNLFPTKKLKGFKIPVPPIQVQKKIIDIIERLESIKKRQKHSISKAEVLFDALIQKAFKGELVS